VATEEHKEEKLDKPKWASEACAFLSLLRKLRKQLSGLLMLELGWDLLVRLPAPLAEDKSVSETAARVRRRARSSKSLSNRRRGDRGILVRFQWLLENPVLLARPTRPPAC
jgi:hypothetical protein